MLTTEQDTSTSNLTNHGQEISVYNPTILFQKSLETINQIEWAEDIRAQKDLNRCETSLILVSEPNIKSPETLLNHIADELININLIRSAQDILDALLTEAIDGSRKFKRYVEVENFLVLATPLPYMKSLQYVVCNLTEPHDVGLNDPVSFVTLILGPSEAKENKTVYKVARSFASAYCDARLRHGLVQASNLGDMQSSFRNFVSQRVEDTPPITHSNPHHVIPPRTGPLIFGSLINDISKRLPVYRSDWIAPFHSKLTFAKIISATFFLFFACLLPAIAFGVLNQNNTNGEMTVAKVILAQGLGGIIFSLFSGQPMVILLTTAPLSIFIKLTYSISQQNSIDFWSFYSLIGIFNGIFLLIYSIFGVSSLMKYSSRFVEETFAVFITIAFIYDGAHPLIETYVNNIYEQEPLLMLIIMVLTLWICYKLSVFKETVFFKRSVREVISDYALPLGVLLASAISHAVFFKLEFTTFSSNRSSIIHIISSYSSLPIWSYFAALGIGFLLSLLFFVDQNVSCMLASSPSHNLKKWTGFHLDLLVTGVINIVFSVIGLPWIHGAIPHSALHVRALATLQVSLHNGVAQEQFISVLETRLSAFLSHCLLLLSLLLIPIPLIYIPVAVLYGVFWYLGIKGLPGNQFWRRLLLLITDQNCYPGSIADRQLKQREVHLFTLVQIVCLIVFCFVALYPNPYMTATFPFLVVLLIPVRRYLLPKLFRKRALDLLDGY